MSGAAPALESMIASAQASMQRVAVEANPRDLGVLTLNVLALHGRVARMLATIPDVFGDDVPWADIGDRELYVSAVLGALTVQRGRISALSDLRDTSALLETCRLSMQTLAAVVRDVQRIFPGAPPRPRVSRRRAAAEAPSNAGTVRLRVISPA